VLVCTGVHSIGGTKLPADSNAYWWAANPVKLMFKSPFAMRVGTAAPPCTAPGVRATTRAAVNQHVCMAKPATLEFTGLNFIFVILKVDC
jgi:hypothetical protein